MLKEAQIFYSAMRKNSFCFTKLINQTRNQKQSEAYVREAQTMLQKKRMMTMMMMMMKTKMMMMNKMIKKWI